MSFKTSATCPRKATARQQTIIDIYKELFQKSLPYNKQYWTLAGPCYDNKGKLGTNSEIWQLTAAGLIFARQYHGIDNSEEIIRKNKLAAPGANFYHGDFVSQLQVAAESGNFNPGVINCDFTKMIKASSVDVGNVMNLLDRFKIRDTLVIVNVPVNNPYQGKLKPDTDTSALMQEAWETLTKNQRFNAAWNSEYCKLYPSGYVYQGTGKNSKTTMMTLAISIH
jgi:hypothetical protein